MKYAYYLFENAAAFETAYATLSDSEKVDVTNLGVIYDDEQSALPGYHVNAAWRSNQEPEAFVPFRADPSEAPARFDGIPVSSTEEAAEIPQTVSLRQLLFALVSHGWLTEVEAMAAARTGDFPESFEPLIANLPSEEAFSIRLTWAAMYSADRASPFWDLLITNEVATEEDINNVFLLASQV